jgi:exoribonuclease-2
MARPDSLVLYKTRPARVQHVGKKLDIELEDGSTLKVRPKDVALLHPGPLENLNQLMPQVGEIETAWELLAGTRTTLAELAELAYDAYTPATAWAAWQVVADGLYFHGTPEIVEARPADELAREQADRATRAAEERAWAAFLQRLRRGRSGPEDNHFLREVEEVALGRRTKSRTLRELGRSEKPEAAHRLLVQAGYWDATSNPYPQRLGLPTRPVEVALPSLPEEVRQDFTHLPALAIDDEGSQDPDDALSLDGQRLWVHVADVGAVVPPNSAADLEARGRGANLYLPEGTVQMLPAPALHLLGLGLAEVSPALSFGLAQDPQGQIELVEVVPSWVRVTRLTYQEAEARLNEEPLRSLLALALVYQARRKAQGAVSINLPEVRIQVSGDKISIQPIEQLKSRELVTEAMLMTGEAVAGYAAAQEIPIPFTTQNPPRTDERPDDMSGMFALRRAFQPSGPSSAAGSHAGLGLPIYAQATSPLRRYLDLVVHQQMRAHLHGESLLTDQEILERIGATAAVMGSVRQAERLSRKHWTLVYLQELGEWQGEGVLVDKRGKRGTVLIPELDLDTQVQLRADHDLNSAVSIELTKVDLPALAVHFRVRS